MSDTDIIQARQAELRKNTHVRLRRPCTVEDRKNESWFKIEPYVPTANHSDLHEIGLRNNSTYGTVPRINF